jgi:hypothetical protein
MGLFDAARDAEGRPKANKLVRVASGFRPDDLVLTDSPDSHSPARNGIGGLYGPPAETLTVTSAGASVNLAIRPPRMPHRGGRRSGDQFCASVADRLVLPILSQEDIAAIASGRHQMDGFVRRYIHENLCYRFVILPDGAAAYAAEAAIKGGAWEYGRPLLNPGR